MRKIKIRGLDISGTWVYFDLEFTEQNFFIKSKIVNIDKKTIGQFTGLYDKNGIEIYEGDLVVTPSDRNGVIEYGHGRFGVNWDYETKRKTMLGSWGSVDNLRTLSDNYNSKLQVVGNIHEII